MEWEDYTRQEEEYNESACKTAAQAAGHSDIEADSCDIGELKCPLCPWRICPECGSKRKYSYIVSTDNPIDGYDADYCEVCNIWLEPKCSDADCEFCSVRPERPLDLLK